MPKRLSRRPFYAPDRWPIVFVVGYIACQISLLFVGSTPLRVPARIGAFASSLLLLAILPVGRDRHPGARWVPCILCTLGVSFMISGGEGVTAAAASAAIYLATLAPLFWVSGRPVSYSLFFRVVLLLWAFNVSSAAVGVLQVYYPNMFQSQLSAAIVQRGQAFIGSLTIVLANGARVFRPMGLTDMPGGAAGGGLNAITLGIGVALTTRSRWLRAAAIAGTAVGLCVILLTNVRIALIMAGVSAAVVLIAIVRRGDLRRVTLLSGAIVGIAFIGFSWAFAVGGEGTINRFASLTSAAPSEVYQSNRGWFLEDAFTNQLFLYPLGAGPGRWGMVSVYFGDPARGLWAEVMWAAWIYDGGVLMMIAYNAMIVSALAVAWRIASRSTSHSLAIWGAVVMAYDVAAIAATFSSPFFGTQGALELWFLNAILYAAWHHSPRQQVVAQQASR